MSNSFSHLDKEGNPSMVDVTGKKSTGREAVAQAVVTMDDATLEELKKVEFQTGKGPVFQTAILAGIMAAKRTGELIPLCHPLGLSHCDVKIGLTDAGEIDIRCTAKIQAATGVEMEALTGATVAALTIYDMCKAFSHNIIIREIRLLEKKGGKSDFRHTS